MSKKLNLEKVDILNAAIQVIKKKGLEDLTIRAIAKELKISTQPLYFRYKNFDEIRKELLEYSSCKYTNISSQWIKEGRYREYGMAFFNFAKDEPELFRFFYLQEKDKNWYDVDKVVQDKIVKVLADSIELDFELASDFHNKMFTFCYAIATQIATGYRIYDTDKLICELELFSCILLKHYKNIKNDEELKYWSLKLR